MEKEIKYPGLWAKCLKNEMPVWGSTETCNELVIGEIYKVVQVDMGGFNTDIYLEGSDKRYNSIIFEFYKDGNLHDIYKDPTYNGFIR